MTGGARLRPASEFPPRETLPERWQRVDLVEAIGKRIARTPGADTQIRYGRCACGACTLKRRQLPSRAGAIKGWQGFDCSFPIAASLAARPRTTLCQRPRLAHRHR
jgi:hypothetical protein